MRFSIRRSDILLVSLVLAALLGAGWFATRPRPSNTPPDRGASAATPSEHLSATAATGDTLVVLGDDLAMAPTTAGPGWAERLGTALNVTTVNLATPGGGYTTSTAPTAGCPTAPCSSFLSLLDQVVAQNPYLVVVSAGSHDVGADPLVVARSTGEVILALKRAMPTTLIVVTDPLSVGSATPEKAAALSAQMSEAATTRAALWIPARDSLAGEQSGIDASGAITTEGHQLLASTIAMQLQALGVTPAR